MSKNSWLVTEVANGFILAKSVDTGYASGTDETFVFNSSVELANWIRRNLKQEEEAHEES